MSDGSTSQLIELARARSLAQTSEEHVPDYRQVARLLIRLTDLDSRCLGPELAKLQDLSRPVSPQPLGIRGRIRGLFFKAMNPVLGRLLRAASLASPYEAAYELTIDLLSRQLDADSKMQAEIAVLKDRIETLEAQAKSRRFAT